MITIFIKALLFIAIIYIFLYLFSFSMYEFKQLSNKFGAIATIIFSLVTAVSSLIVVALA